MVSEPIDRPGPTLRLDRLPTPELDTACMDLLNGLESSEAATDIIREACRTMAAREEAVRTRLLHTVVNREPLEDLASETGCPEPALVLLGRGCVQPIAEALAHHTTVELKDGAMQCSICGWPPQVAETRDAGDVRGARFLVCGLCGAPWTFSRGICPSCREAKPDQIDLHVAESLPHIRVESCRTCSTYLKAIDLRVDGFAVAQVDDVASVELDLWADEQGLRKLLPNVLGM